MSMYLDYQNTKGKGSSIDKMVPISPNDEATIRALYPAIPADYVDFLLTVGAGEIGDAAFALYSGPVEPEEIYGDSDGVENILLIGDDLQGFNVGYELDTWSVVEIDPTNRSTRKVASDFQSFIRTLVSTYS